MSQGSVPLTSRPEWQALKTHQAELESTHMRELFSDDPGRASRFFIRGGGLSLDYSRNRMTDDTLAKLMALARKCGVPEQIEAMFRGDHINVTEKRPALHIALRDTSGASIHVDGTDITPEVEGTLNRMAQFVDDVLSERWQGHTGKAFTDVVSIGIGGSFLGPKLVSEALRPYWHGQLKGHYVANIDGTQIAEVLRRVNPETTLFLIQSKSFRTQETLENSKVARDWFLDNGGSEDQIAKHFVAVTANTPEAVKFGISEDNIFPMWDWVGGRYSLWSAIGLPVALTIGMENFRALLSGANAMDQHFHTAPLEQNLPVVIAMLGVWYNNFWGAETYTILPYDHYLRSLPAHLQQLDMESNGKSVTQGGEPLTYQSGPVIWGGVGANGQHAFHQLLHQGTRLIPADFIIPLETHNPVASHHVTLFANCLSQSRALMSGKTLDEAKAELKAEGMSSGEIDKLAPHKVIPGNKPSNTLLMEKSTPETVGALIALYEHRTFVQGIIWDVDSFDQWGVELGKQMGKGILDRLTGDTAEGDEAIDSSTASLIQIYRSHHGA
ncbi:MULTISPECIES: glucose-6-phosphate isomerase [Marinobacter]|jgi:glucose-6-phosphate isomerase|uniref:glucose-6-phosphate isomerase n=1 Tax=Marinobacter TaxID=2742 RepID=UPI00094906CF|nr:MULTISPECIES: glucose-6-phosphate isomerase [Marinobacter]AZR40481.1 glucose-6-phosphate isomerase [Marinobacter salarius]MCZ4287010.1 glucose-6-phosphate isomerase [Marinobacter salarius]OLF83517.1 glucose-6-phosphate isomerase [Marinobacter sp. C18]RUT76734.1 glucose-6-phosphate isomerase [Marinobacter sp. NP-6]|tara:strand:- start:1997 stop:3661 length:1665 start_codon:yes stop_codon:yes gene_type:complete